MPTYEKQLQDIRERLSAVEGHLRGAASTNKPNWLLNAFITLACTGLLGYLAWLGFEVVRQGKQIAVLTQILAPEIIKDASLHPGNPRATNHVRAVLEEAKKQGQKIDPELIREAGAKFIDAASNNPEAWSAATAFLDYRSFLNVDFSPSTKDFVAYRPGTAWDFDISMSTKPNVPIRVQLKVSRFVPAERAAVMERIDHHLNSGVAAGPEFLAIDGISIPIDRYTMKNIIFSNSQITYNGGPLEMQNVYFINCSFDVTREAPGKNFAKAVLADVPTAFTHTEPSLSTLRKRTIIPPWFRSVERIIQPPYNRKIPLPSQSS